VIANSPIVIAYLWYVSIIAKRNKALEALSGIDVQMKKRANLIPNILKIAQTFMNHERSLFGDITKLRTQALAHYNHNDPSAVSEHFNAVDQLSEKVGQLMMNVESYPELKSDTVIIQTQQTYNEVELQIAASRRFYNSAVNILNNSVQIFPGNIIAHFMKVSEMPFYEADKLATESINVDYFIKIG
jgi:LemA protein